MQSWLFFSVSLNSKLWELVKLGNVGINLRVFQVIRTMVQCLISERFGFADKVASGSNACQVEMTTVCFMGYMVEL